MTDRHDQRNYGMNSDSISPGENLDRKADQRGIDFLRDSDVYGAPGWEGGRGNDRDDSGRVSRGWGIQTQRGKGPKGYQRSDDRIKEDICEMLTHDPVIDASEIDVDVKTGEVTLSGTVETRTEKHRTEDLVLEVSGVRDLHNLLKIKSRNQ